MLLCEITGYQLDKNTNMKLPTYKYHSVWLMDAIALSTNQRKKILILYNV